MTLARRSPRLANYLGQASELSAVGRVQVGGKIYAVVGLDADIYAFLGDLARYLRHNNPQPNRLIRSRHDFRMIIGRRSPLGVLLSLQSDGYLERRLAVWLLGRMNWRRGIAHLRNFPPTAPLELQFEIARAMKRLRAWTNLRQLELQVSRYPETGVGLSTEYVEQQQQRLARLRAMCQQSAARDYSSRLSQFLSGGVSSAMPSGLAEQRRQTFWYQEPLGPGQPAKSRWFIRRLLERIRIAVRG